MPKNAFFLGIVFSALVAGGPALLSAQPHHELADKTDKEGEIILVPRGVEHCPRTGPDEEVHVLVVEPLGTTHTGKAHDQRTAKEFNRI
jgi:hypothetical protein